MARKTRAAARRRRRRSDVMNRFAELLDRLAYEPGRNNKLRLMTDYFRATADPERGWALAALTGALSFPARQSRPDPQPDRRAHRSGAVRAVLRLRRRPVRNRRADVAAQIPPRAGGGGELSLTAVVETLATLGKSQLPRQLRALARCAGRDRVLGGRSSSSLGALRGSASRHASPRSPSRRWAWQGAVRKSN